MASDPNNGNVPQLFPLDDHWIIFCYLVDQPTGWEVDQGEVILCDTN